MRNHCLATFAAIATFAVLAPMVTPAPAMAANPPGDATPALVRVTAGDVGGTSRVAFNFTPTDGFRVEQAARAVTVIFPGADLRFAYDAVYPRRAASRIVFAGPTDHAGAAAFTLRFNCDCETSVVLDQAQRVLVELRDRSETVAPPSLTGVEAAAETAAAPRKVALPMPRPRPAGRPMSGNIMAGHQPAADDAAAVPPANGVISAHEIDRLRASLRWAAQQGFIAAKPADVDAAPASAAALAEPPANITNLPPPSTGKMTASKATAAAPAPNAPPAAAADTMAQADSPPGPGQTGPGEAGPHCAGSETSPLVDWQTVTVYGEDFATAMGQQRANLLVEAGPGALADMALFYLSQGFTREALSAVNALDPAPAALRVAALILLGRGDEADQALLDQAACGADGPVWRAAWLKAKGRTAAAATIAQQAIQPLADFPKFPRTVLALALADGALDAGNTKLAERLLELVASAPGQDVENDVAVLRGRIALAHGQQERADWYFAQALKAGGEARRRARLALIAHAIAQGETPPAWAQDVMRGALFDYRGDRELLPIALMAADLHMANGDYPQALDELASAAHRLPDTVDQAPIAAKARTILRAAFAMPDAVDDAAALRLFTAHGHYLNDDDASNDLRTALAQRLLRAGLPSAAGRILEPLTRAPPTPAVVLLQAEATLRSGRPAAALALLVELDAQDAATGSAADALRRQALTQLGRYGEAAAFADPKTAANLHWAAGDWQQAKADFERLLASAPTQAATPADGATAIRALAAAYMAGPEAALPPAAAAKAMAIAIESGLGDAASALTATTMPTGQTLPDAVALVLERSRQVRSLFSPAQPGS